MSDHPGLPENLDYEPTMNVAAAHAAVAREKDDHPVKGTPLSLGAIALIIGVGILGGSYIGANAGWHYNLRGKTYQPENPPGDIETGPEVPADVKWLAEGKKNYETVCASCHQPTGLGQPGKYPPLAGSEYVINGEERLATIVIKGLAGPLTVKGASYGADQMAGKGGAIWSAKTVAQVLSYIRNSWGNKGSFIMDDQIKDHEAKIAALPSPLPTSELATISADANLPPSKKPLTPGAPAAGAAPAPAPGAPAPAPGTPAPQAPAPAPQ